MKEQLQLKNHLKEVRTEANLSQAQLAEMVGVSRNTISSIETEMCIRDSCNISRTFGFYNTLINRQKALKGVLSMSVLQTIDLKKYYGTEPNITRALDGVNF